ncbi:MAG TPA: EscU/YscU/HrcU family type III secretion system export apparatus switch protein [Lacunisphaera sp.]|nr:EscU/YscU/HrcU family type III secretion system export apparatus switch protein [Lacunisphaera sp.]
MADTDNDQKTEKPTGKRLADAADKGQFAKSPELSVLFSLAAALGILGFTATNTARSVAEYSISIFASFGRSPVELSTVSGYMGDIMQVVGGGLMPVLLGCACAALLVGGIQSGFHLSTKVVRFKLEGLNPVNGFHRIFSKDTLIRAGIDLLKLAAIGFTLFLGARTLLMDPLFTAPVEASYLGTFLNTATLSFFSRLMLSLGVIASMSYAWEKYKTSRDLMMTKQEVKDEAKNQEGDQQVKGAMRRMARRMIQKQMLAAVPTADVVVTNPTHFAVVLKYERGRDKAPVVLAKGENRFALRLKAIAAEHGVPTVENKPVARLLFAMGEVGEAIPPGLYQAVAEILAVVYRTHRYYFHELKTRRLSSAA